VRVSRREVRLLPRARRLGALEEEGQDKGTMKMPRPTGSGSSGDGRQAANPTLCPTPKYIRCWDPPPSNSNAGPATT
jgi:hypothetical protein